MYLDYLADHLSPKSGGLARRKDVTVEKEIMCFSHAVV